MGVIFHNPSTCFNSDSSLSHCSNGFYGCPHETAFYSSDVHGCLATWLPQDPSPAETPIAEPVEACAAAEQAEINEEAAAEPTGEVTPLASRDESRENTLGNTEGRLKEI